MAFPTLDFDLLDKNDVPSAAGGQIGQVVRFHKAITTDMLELGKVTRLGTLPAGSRVVSGYAKSDDLDTDGSPALRIDIGVRDASGTIDDEDKFFNNTNIAVAGAADDVWITGNDTYCLEDTDVTFTTAIVPATAAAGNFTLVLTVILP